MAPLHHPKATTTMKRNSEMENIKLFLIILGIYCLFSNIQQQEINLLHQAEINLLQGGNSDGGAAAGCETVAPTAATALPQKKKKKKRKRLDPFPRMPKDIAEAMQWIVQAREQRGDKATFLQIGANDGQMNDPLYPQFPDTALKNKWIGLQVEPQPELYGSLAVLHADAPDWAFYLGAVATPKHCIDGRIEFCETKTPGMGDWVTQGQVNHVGGGCDEKTMHIQQRPCVTSFDELIYRHGTPAYLEQVLEEEEEAVVVSPRNASETERIYSIDHLQIDVEGNDYQLLTLIDWKQLHPTCISYESFNLREEKKQAAKDLMKEMGYTVVEYPMDVLACQVQQGKKQQPQLQDPLFY